MRFFSSSPVRRGLEQFFETGQKWVWTDKLTTGRAWTPELLRNKSFDDLHTLWYSCLVERNKLHSQKTEAARFQMYYPFKTRMHQVAMTMARIKTVLWERRRDWLKAEGQEHKSRRNTLKPAQKRTRVAPARRSTSWTIV